MKFGCCLNMVATKADATGTEWIKAAKAAGFDYLELPLAEIMALTEEQVQKIRGELIQNDIPCEACNNFFPKTMRLTGQEVDIESVMSYVNKALKMAASLGAKRVVFGSGGAKNVPEGFSLQTGYQQVVSLLKKIAPIAKKYDIIISIEPLRKAECNLINTFEEGVKLATNVGSDFVRVLVDFYHLTEENEPVDHLLMYGNNYLQHVHFAKPEGRVYPSSAEAELYIPFINVLKEIGYDERVSCEAYSDNFRDDSKKTVEFFRKFFR